MMSTLHVPPKGPPAVSQPVKSQHNTLAPASTSIHYDFHTVTCVAWSASGRNLGIGTPDGLLLYSTEPVVSQLSGADAVAASPLPSLAPASTPDTTERAALQEVCRCAVFGGVGHLSLYKQCSVVAFAGVQRRTAATRLQLADLSQTPLSSFYINTTVPTKTTANTVGTTSVTATGAGSLERPSSRPRAARPWPAEEDAAVAQWYENWRSSAFVNAIAPPPSIAAVLAFVECPATLAALQFNPHVVVAATSGDPKIAGSHTLYVFDHRLQPLYTLPIYPPSSNAYLTDMIAIAAAFTSSNGAGMMVQRLRVLLPGERKGEVRLLTLKKSTLTATAYDVASSSASIAVGGRRGDTHAASYASGDTHRIVDRVLHQAPLRAVAISEDGRSAVTMSNQGMRLRVLDFVGDDIIHERLSLDRGRLPAVVDTVSLAIAPIPQPGGRHGLHFTHNDHDGHPMASGDGGLVAHKRCGSSSDSGVVNSMDLPNRQFQLYLEALHDIVVCLTSSGTMHVFGCGLRQVLFYHSDKTLLPRVGYPFAFSICLPSQLVHESGATLFVARSDVETSAARYLPRRELWQVQHGKGSGAAAEAAANQQPADLFAFQLRYPASVSKRDAREAVGGAGEAPRSSLFVRCSLAG